MKFAKYILNYSCLCAFCTGACFSAYSGEDPDIKLLKEAIESLRSETGALREADKNFEAENQNLKTLITELKTEVGNSFTELNKGLTEVKDTLSAGDKNAEQLQSLQEKVTAIEETTKTSSSSGRVQQLSEDVAAVKTELQTLSETKLSEELLVTISGAVDEINKKLEAQKEIDEQQNLDAAKNAARLDKMERMNSSAATGSGSNLFGSALQGGIGLLSNGSVSSLLGSALQGGIGFLSKKIANGESTEELSRNMTEDERRELQVIEMDIRSGKTSDQEIQAKMSALQEKVVLREAEENRFQKVTFYGLNEGFKQRTVVLHILNQARLGNKVPIESILSGNINSVDIELMDTIYDMAQKNATMMDIDNNIKLIFSGSPRKVVKGQMESTGYNQNSSYNQTPTSFGYNDMTQPIGQSAGFDQRNGTQSGFRDTQGNIAPRSGDMTQPIGQSAGFDQRVGTQGERRDIPGNTTTRSGDMTQTVGQTAGIDQRNGTQSGFRDTQGNVAPRSGDMTQPIGQSAGFDQRVGTQGELRDIPGNTTTRSGDMTQPVGQSAGFDQRVGTQGELRDIPGNITTRSGDMTQPTGQVAGHDQRVGTQGEFRDIPGNTTTRSSDMTQPVGQSAGFDQRSGTQGFGKTAASPGHNSGFVATVKNSPQQDGMQSQIDETAEPLDMTVMDIDDNTYYDVTKHKFMKIAKKSVKFPKVTKATSMNVNVKPIDNASADRLALLNR